MFLKLFGSKIMAFLWHLEVINWGLLGLWLWLRWRRGVTRLALCNWRLWVANCGAQVSDILHLQELPHLKAVQCSSYLKNRQWVWLTSFVGPPTFFGEIAGRQHVICKFRWSAERTDQYISMYHVMVGWKHYPPILIVLQVAAVLPGRRRLCCRQCSTRCGHVFWSSWGNVHEGFRRTAGEFLLKQLMGPWIHSVCWPRELSQISGS